MKIGLLIIALLSLIPRPIGSEELPLFPVPDGMALQIQFWINVFTLYSDHQMIIHDADKPERIYKIVDFRAYFPDGGGDRIQEREILEREKDKVISILKKLSTTGITDSLSREELRIYRLFGTKPTKNTFVRAAQSVRIQDGMRETFLDGLVRSGRYLTEVKVICEHYDLPEELAYLPHIESSFNPHAQSKYGAVGMWQFTRTTGREYLTIRTEIDERRDPYLSTEAAARHLKMLYRNLGSWPLAITAYNHGLSGIRQAVRRVGSTDLSEIIREYQNKNFGFASKNFYAEFMAAVWVSENVSQYFGQVHYASPLRMTNHELQENLPLSKVIEMFDTSIDELKDLNPALRTPIFREEKDIPEGYRLKLPIRGDEYVFDNSTILENQPSPQNIDEQNNNPETGKWTMLLKNVETWMKTVFSLNRTQTQQSGDENPLFWSVEESEMANKPEMDLSSSIIPENAVSIYSDLQLTEFEITASLHVDGESVVVQPDETLGHYADWLEIPTWTLRRLNNLNFYQQIRIGQKIILSFDRVSKTQFEERRLSYHQEIRKQFFEQYRIEKSITHTVGRGETLWTLAVYRYDVPLWLLMAYNQDKDPNRVKPGEIMTIPIIEKVTPPSNGTT
ncbi:transglycosylase SLT domain-containing protein [bacterium]|nr:transglycosylase SLT domain-containing protein [bacterium]